MAANSPDDVAHWHAEVRYLEAIGDDGFEVLHGAGRPDFLDMANQAAALYDQDADLDDEDDPDEFTIEITYYRDSGEIYTWAPDDPTWTDGETFEVLRSAAESYDPDHAEWED
jgi:hypothetical protein